MHFYALCELNSEHNYNSCASSPRLLGESVIFGDESRFSPQ